MFSGALWWRNFVIFHISWTARCIKLVGSSKWVQEWIYYGHSKICTHLTQQDVPKKCLYFAFYFLGLMKWNFHIMRTISLNWPTFQNDRKTHLSISIYWHIHSWIHENWWNRKKVIDESCEDPKKSVLTVSMVFLCWFNF